LKLCKWHTLVFRCPSCGHAAEYAAEIIEGPRKGSMWDPAYWCEKCETTLRARDKWLFGAAFGPLMALVGTFAMQAVPPGLHLAQWLAFAFAALCCGVVGWPLSRLLSRHLLYWEPLDPAGLRRAELRRLREDDD
jgi:hypothetical protein